MSEREERRDENEREGSTRTDNGLLEKEYGRDRAGEALEKGYGREHGGGVEDCSLASVKKAGVTRMTKFGRRNVTMRPPTATS